MVVTEKIGMLSEELSVPKMVASDKGGVLEMLEELGVPGMAVPE